ncbi:MAG: hypothetical protein HUU16_14050 [Candidatus Omnitrophica bacterium]|nr:hypothetical protein [Candidatus Omnitrophota bacterium]
MRPPEPPWLLYGWAGLLIDWISYKKIKDQLVPKGLTKRRFLGFNTLSGHYFGCYRPIETTTFSKPFHEFGYIPCIAGHGRSKGYVLSRMAVDFEDALEGGRRHWRILKVEGSFEEFGEYGLRVSGDQGRLKVSVEFKKLFSLGYWETPFCFLNRVGEAVYRYNVTYHGELFFCRAPRQGLNPNGWVFPLLFDRCWITLHAPILLDAPSKP